MSAQWPGARSMPLCGPARRPQPHKGPAPLPGYATARQRCRSSESPRQLAEPRSRGVCLLGERCSRYRCPGQGAAAPLRAHIAPSVRVGPHSEVVPRDATASDESGPLPHGASSQSWSAKGHPLSESWWAAVAPVVVAPAEAVRGVVAKRAAPSVSLRLQRGRISLPHRRSCPCCTACPPWPFGPNACSRLGWLRVLQGPCLSR